MRTLRWLAAPSLVLLSGLAAAAEAIKNPARAWDHLWHEYLVDVTIIGVLFALITIYFMVKYRRRSADEEGRPPTLSTAAAVGWAIIPAFAFMADDFFLAARSWDLWNMYREVPADRMEVKLESAMWSWNFTYPNGVEAQTDLRVPQGKPIMLRMTSRDVVHSFYAREFRVKEDSMPGRVTYLWFYPEKVGEFLTTCAEFCGMMHSKMTGKIIVMPPEQFASWYKEEDDKRKLAAAQEAAKPAEAPAAAPAQAPAAAPAPAATGS